MEAILQALPFLKSKRFYAIVWTAVIAFVRGRGWLQEDVMTLILTISAGATAVGIVGWASDKIGNANPQ
jgi:hypothetical protein